MHFKVARRVWLNEQYHEVGTILEIHDSTLAGKLLDKGTIVPLEGEVKTEAAEGADPLVPTPPASESPAQNLQHGEEETAQEALKSETSHKRQPTPAQIQEVIQSIEANSSPKPEELSAGSDVSANVQIS